MLLLKNKTDEIIIPKGWHQITCGQYDEILEIINEGDENEVRVKAKIIATCTGKQPSEILKQPLIKINQQFDELSWLKDKNFTQGRFINEVELNGTTYIVNPSIASIESDRFIALSQFLNEPDNKQRSKLVALFLRPKVGNIENENFNQLVDDVYNHCPCSVLIPLSNFFFLLSKNLKPHIQRYFQNKIKIQLKEVQDMVSQTMNELIKEK